jgi:hypothetical protein
MAQLPNAVNDIRITAPLGPPELHSADRAQTAYPSLPATWISLSSARIIGG